MKHAKCERQCKFLFEDLYAPKLPYNREGLELNGTRVDFLCISPRAEIRVHEALTNIPGKVLTPGIEPVTFRYRLFGNALHLSDFCAIMRETTAPTRAHNPLEHAKCERKGKLLFDYSYAPKPSRSSCQKDTFASWKSKDL